MPKPFKGSVVHSRARCVEERAECAKLIGSIAAEWSNLETIFANYFALFLFGFRDEEIQKEHGGERIALDVIENTPSFQAKRTLLLNAAFARFGEDDAACKKLQKELGRLDSVHRQRNNVVHGRWALSDDLPDALIWRGRISSHDFLIYEPGDFQELLEKIMKAQEIINVHLRVEFHPKLKVLPRPARWHTIRIEE